VRKYMLALPVLIALLAGSTVGVMAQDEADLVTEEVEPGVERIIRDEVGHDLDETHPTYRYDMDRIAVAPDGTVWLRTTYSRSDNTANKRPGSRGFEGPTLVWALGRAGTYMIGYETPRMDPGTYLYEEPVGTKTVITVEVLSSEDAGSIPFFGEGGTPSRSAIPVPASDGEHICGVSVERVGREEVGVGVTCTDPSGEQATYLADTRINQIAAAPDGKLWAVGGYDGDNGGLYRITLD
jgi:hypothetical protein